MAGASYRSDPVSSVGPVVAVLLGIVLLVAGVALTMVREDSEEYEYENDEPAGSTT